MKCFKYLIIWCVIFRENVSKNIPDGELVNSLRTDDDNVRKAEDKRTTTELQDHQERTLPGPDKPTVKTERKMPPTASPDEPITPASLISDQTPDPSLITIPKYGIGLIGFAIVILSLIILLLLLMLYRLQRKKYADSICEEFKPKTQDTSKYSRQVSGGEISNISTTLTKDVNKESKLCLNRNDSRALLFKDPSATILNLKGEDLKTSRPSVYTDTPTNNHSTRKPTLSRVLPHQPNPVISRQQMSVLLAGVLAKTNKPTEAISLTDLDKFYNNEPQEKDKADIEKCLSTPELDSEIYDVLPNESPKKVERKFDIAKKSSEKDDVKDDVIEDSIYDNPPPRNDRKRNVVLNADDHEENGLTDYVVPISKDPGMYGNCKTVQMA